MTSDRGLRIASAVVAVIGLGVAVYLTVVHLSGSAPICTAGGGCETVQNSHYAHFAGIPVPIIGLVGWVLYVATAIWRGAVASVAALFFGVIGVGFSVYLIYLQLGPIDAICEWCMADAGLWVVAFAVAAGRFAVALGQEADTSAPAG